MKVFKIKSFKMLLNFSFAILLLTNACAQSNKSTDTEKASSSTTASVTESPEMELMPAIMSGNLQAVKQHIAAGTDINLKDQMSGSTPLMSAVTFDKTAILKALIEAKADLEVKNNDGATALHIAAFFCRVEAVQLLIDAKADKTVKNNFGATPRESVMGPFEQIKPVYEMVQQQLAPLGVQIDMNELEKKRPVVAMMLQ